MTDSNVRFHRALLFDLDGTLSLSLSDALAHCGCTVFRHDAGADRPQADIVFCSNQPATLSQALAQFKPAPVVVVSRLPEVEGWLDALEAGAADYCAAPFEPAQLGWLLETHTRPCRALAAA